MNDPYVLAANQGEALWSLGCLTTFKADRVLTNGAFALVDEVAPKSEGTPLHRHNDDDESFFILDGELLFHLGDAAPAVALPGTFVHIPKGVPHAFRVQSQTARYLILTTVQHSDFYRAIGAPALRRELPVNAPWDMDLLMQAADRYNVEVLGPPPE